MFRTPFNGYSVEFSPFEETRLAVATAQHFGIIGNGKQHILEVRGDHIQEIACFDSSDGLYDCAWSEENENVIASASGDGSVKLWDITSPHGRPIKAFTEHTSEVYSVDWNLINKRDIITGTIWSPHHPDHFASASGDLTLKIWDTKAPNSGQTIHAHDHEILTCDWNKYNEWTVVTGSVDKSLKIWDIRNAEKGPVGSLRGHNYAVRRLKCSPHSETVIASVSYDMSLILWDTIQEEPLVQRYDHHSEFVVGVDFNLFIEGQLATCSWDETVRVWFMGQHP